MKAQVGAYFLLRLKQFNKADQADLEKAIEIANSKSPSKSIEVAQRHHYLKYGDSWHALTYGKGVRWLAIILRDEGLEAFQQKVVELKELFG